MGLVSAQPSAHCTGTRRGGVLVVGTWGIHGICPWATHLVMVSLQVQAFCFGLWMVFLLGRADGEEGKTHIKPLLQLRINAQLPKFANMIY
jgi:hypothetical protein